MKLSRLDIYNFRKLKQCSIEIDELQTIFVGANNSGKTSAMHCLMLFFKDNLDSLSRSASFDVFDFTISNWTTINAIGRSWEEREPTEELDEDVLLDEWKDLLPQLDVWLEVNKDELYYVHKILPSLAWEGGKLGVRLRYEPKDIITLYKDYRELRINIKKLGREDDVLWPKNLFDFLKKGAKLRQYFEVKSYVLPSELFEDENCHSSLTSNPLDFNPFKDILRISLINAQRGFGDVDDSDTGYENLSSQLRRYYNHHLSSDEFIEASDIDIIELIAKAKKEFDIKFSLGFEGPLKELERLGYPGFGNPNISLSSELDPIDSFKHESAVLFNVDCEKEFAEITKLTERHNGLGYQNLISMTFKLIAFREAWMKGGKLKFSQKDRKIEPLHIVLIEEPEAHLHAQVQQVFIKKAYERLRDHPNLRNNKGLHTQLIVSTHSNHIIEQVDFCALRYFKRQKKSELAPIPTATVANVSEVFGDNKTTTNFAKRYLKLTHANLFFADAIILVEGQAEMLLVPRFINERYTFLDESYISLLNISGSHAHTLKPLIEKLDIVTLIITDLDAGNKDDNRVKERATTGKGQVTRNSTLKTWLPKEKDLDILLVAKDSDKISRNSLIRVAYQTPITTKLGSNEIDIIPDTFEDALIYESENIKFLKKYTEELEKEIEEKNDAMKSLSEDKEKNKVEIEFVKNEIDLLKSSNKNISKVVNALSSETDIENQIYKVVNKEITKAEFALELLYLEKLAPPKYIKEGLDWLSETLGGNNE